MVSGNPRRDHSFQTLSNHLKLVINPPTPPIARTKFLTPRCSGVLPFPWFPPCHNTAFPSSVTVERIEIISPGSFSIIERCQVLDATFSGACRCPSLKELEVPSFVVTRTEKKDVRILSSPDGNGRVVCPASEVCMPMFPIFS